MSFLNRHLSRPKPQEERSQRQVSIAGDTLSLTLIRSRRRRRKLSLQLDTDGGLVVRAPFAARLLEIDSLIQRNADWIVQRRHELQQQPCPPALNFVDGEAHLYLGQHYVLNIHAAASRRMQKVELAGGVLSVYATEPDAVKRLLQNWYCEQAQQLFERRLAFFAGQLGWVESTPELRLRRMRSRWGSCSSQGRVCLNTHLIKASERCIDYVIVHELCHLQEFNHSPRFYALLDSGLRNWRECQAELESCGAALIRE